MESGVEHLKRMSMSTTCSVILGKGRFLQEMVEVTVLWCKTQSYAEGGKLEAVLTFLGMDGTKDGTMANTMVWAINYSKRQHWHGFRCRETQEDLNEHHLQRDLRKKGRFP
jgi:hypothetical protein